MWWRGAGWIPRRLDWLRSHHLVGLASFHFENASEGKKQKQSNHPGCQSAINWIAFQAKLWGWSMARKCLSTRLQLLLGCVCVCAYENESWHERLFCLAAAQWCKPLETAPLFFRLITVSTLSEDARRDIGRAARCLLALLWTRPFALRTVQPMVPLRKPTISRSTSGLSWKKEKMPLMLMKLYCTCI